MAMAARRPAPPPPTIRTSCAARMTLSLTSPLLVRQHLPVVVDDHPVAAAVVELFPAAPAPAGVAQILGDQTLMVLGHVPLAAVPVSARCEPRFKGGSGGTHGPPPLGAGTVTSDQQNEPAPCRPDCEGLPLWSPVAPPGRASPYGGPFSRPRRLAAVAGVHRGCAPDPAAGPVCRQ